MNYNLVVCQAMVFVFVFSLVGSVNADDIPEVGKEGGLPAEERWDKSDVENYLDLPYRISIDDIAKKLEKARGIGDHLIIKDDKLIEYRKLIEEWKPGPRQEGEGKEISLITFGLCNEKMSVFHVNVYDYKSWNLVCENILHSLTTRVSLWNNIPDIYKVEKDDDIYTITRTGRDNPEKWYFDLSKMLIIRLRSEFSEQEVGKNEEDKIEQIDQIIRNLMLFFEDKKTIADTQKDKYLRIKEAYQETKE